MVTLLSVETKEHDLLQLTVFLMTVGKKEDVSISPDAVITLISIPRSSYKLMLPIKAKSCLNVGVELVVHWRNMRSLILVGISLLQNAFICLWIYG